MHFAAVLLPCSCYGKGYYSWRTLNGIWWSLWLHLSRSLPLLQFCFWKSENFDILFPLSTRNQGEKGEILDWQLRHLQKKPHVNADVIFRILMGFFYCSNILSLKIAFSFLFPFKGVIAVLHKWRLKSLFPLKAMHQRGTNMCTYIDSF